MKRIVFAAVFLAFALPAAAQSDLRQRAIERCKANRGTDCQSNEGLRIWMQEELPMTEQQRQNAAGAANARRREEEASRPKPTPHAPPPSKK
jgi:hypothetical protein